MDIFFDKTANYMKVHPWAIGGFIALIGLVLFLGSVFNWNWLYGDVVQPLTVLVN